MSDVTPFVDAMNAFFARQDAAMADLQGDIDNLNAQIAAALAAAVSPAEKAALQAIQDKASAVSDKLDGLDALTPPVAAPSTGQLLRK